VCNNIPDGGDHVPSAFLAMRMPEPPDPDIQRPDRMQEKMARPTASCNIRGGIFFRPSCDDDNLFGVDGANGTEFAVSWAKKPSATAVASV